MAAHQSKPEWVLQAWMVRWLDKVVLPPCEIRSFDMAGEAMKSVGTRMAALGRGLKPGSGDIVAAQGEPMRVDGIECKIGSGTSTPAQRSTAVSYERCGWGWVRDCKTIPQALLGLRMAGVRLHGNADNMAVEYQVRVEAALVDLKIRKPKKAARPRKPRDNTSKARIRRGAGIYARVLLS